jgi:hypothetical protein
MDKIHARREEIVAGDVQFNVEHCASRVLDGLLTGGRRFGQANASDGHLCYYLTREEST